MSVAGSKSFKVTAVGDGNVGKTSLLMSYVRHEFPQEYLPTVFDTHPKVIHVDGIGHNVNLWDTAGQEEYSRLRPLSYPKTDCFIVCYAVDSPSSYDHVQEIWIPEVRKYCPKAAIVLVGTKLDVKSATSNTNTSTTIVSSKQGKALKKKLSAHAFIECSALTGENLDAVFEEAVRSTLKQKQPKYPIPSLLLCGSK